MDTLSPVQALDLVSHQDVRRLALGIGNPGGINALEVGVVEDDAIVLVCTRGHVDDTRVERGRAGGKESGEEELE